MAKIQQQLIVIKLSKLIKDSTDVNDDIAGPDVTANIEAVTQELLGENVMVEVVTD
jgi:hypothetical protein